MTKPDVDLQSPGALAEDYARRLTGHMGVPDFVYVPTMVARGSGSREVSDGLLVAGDRACILQVKSRSRDAASAETQSRAKQWVKKHAAIAHGQGVGTRSHLVRTQTEFTSLRGYQRQLQLPESTPIVVILDHPKDPEVHLDDHDNTVFISLRDWEGLHFMIRSSSGIIDYVGRVLQAGLSVPLGRESDRCRILAEADIQWAGESPTALPQLPPRPLTDEEGFQAAFFDELIDRVSESSSLGWDANDYLNIVEHLDQTPTLARVQTGKKMISTFKAMVEAKARRSFLTADVDGTSRLAVLYDYTEDDVDDQRLKGFMARIAAYSMLRHEQGVEAGYEADGSTLAIGILHHPKKGRASAFAFCKGSLKPLPDEMRRELESEFGIWNGSQMIRIEGER